MFSWRTMFRNEYRCTPQAVLDGLEAPANLRYLVNNCPKLRAGAGCAPSIQEAP